jgi:hypothetical protein
MLRKVFLNERTGNVVENKEPLWKTATVGARVSCPPSKSPKCGCQFEPVNQSMTGQTRFHAKAQSAQGSQGKDGPSSLPFFALSRELL